MDCTELPYRYLIDTFLPTVYVHEGYPNIRNPESHIGAFDVVVNPATALATEHIVGANLLDVFEQYNPIVNSLIDSALAAFTQVDSIYPIDTTCDFNFTYP